jgi:hypothetical protein
MGHHNGWIFLDWIRHLRTKVPHHCSYVHGKLQMIEMIKRLNEYKELEA